MTHAAGARTGGAARPRLRGAVGLVRACHAGPTALVVSLSLVMAVWSGRDAAGCLLVAATVLSGQLGIGWLNDLVDRGRDAAAARLDKPLVSGAVGPGTVRTAVIVSALACVPLSLANGVLSGTVHLAAVASAWSYDLALKGTVLSPLPYLVSFGLLPAFVTLGLPEPAWPAWWVVAAGSVLGVAAHLVNCVPDIEGDRRTGVLGVPQRLGRARSLRLAAVLGAAGVGLVAAGVATAPGRAIVAFAGIATLAPR